MDLRINARVLSPEADRLADQAHEALSVVRRQGHHRLHELSCPSNFWIPQLPRKSSPLVADLRENTQKVLTLSS